MINYFKIYLLCFVIPVVSYNNIKAQNIFYFKFSEGISDTINVENINGIEFENFIHDLVPSINFYNNRKATVDAISYRIKNNLVVTDKTLSEVFSVFKSDELLLVLKENKFNYESKTLLDLMATKDLNFFVHSHDNYEKELEDNYNKVRNEVLLNVVKLQELNLKMGDFFYFKDSIKALTYYYEIYKFPYYKYRLKQNGNNNSLISSKLFKLHQKAFKKIVTLNQGNRENLEIIKNGKNYYNNCCHDVPELRALLNEHLVEVGLKPIE